MTQLSRLSLDHGRNLQKSNRCLTYFYAMFLFQINAGFISYAGDNKPCCLHKSAEDAITKLRQSSKAIFKWFEDSDMKGNSDKCHMLVSKNGSFAANIGENKISNTKTMKLLGVTFHHPLTFDNHVSTYAKQPVINSIRLLEVHPTWTKILIHIFDPQFNCSVFRWKNHSR